jgi:hypothetical protein
VDTGIGDVPDHAVAEVGQRELGDALGDLAYDAPQMARPFAARKSEEAHVPGAPEERVKAVALVVEAFFDHLGVERERGRRAQRWAKLQ